MAGVKANKPAGARVVTTEYSSHLIFAIWLFLLLLLLLFFFFF